MSDAVYERDRVKHRATMREYHLRRSYGLSVEEREAMGNTCALCGKTQGRMCVDHDHETGDVRGILCLRCNGALGTLGDSIEGLERVIAYLNGTSPSGTP